MSCGISSRIGEICGLEEPAFIAAGLIDQCQRLPRLNRPRERLRSNMKLANILSTGYQTVLEIR
jgi:hypothetical protein